MVSKDFFALRLHSLLGIYGSAQLIFVWFYAILSTLLWSLWVQFLNLANLHLDINCLRVGCYCLFVESKFGDSFVILAKSLDYWGNGQKPLEFKQHYNNNLPLDIWYWGGLGGKRFKNPPFFGQSDHFLWWNF